MTSPLANSKAPWKNFISIVLFLLAFSPMHVLYLVGLWSLAPYVSLEGPFEAAEPVLVDWVLPLLPLAFIAILIIWWLFDRAKAENKHLEPWLKRFGWIVAPLFVGGLVSIPYYLFVFFFLSRLGD